MRLLVLLAAVACGGAPPCFSDGKHAFIASLIESYPAGCTGPSSMNVTITISSDTAAITEDSSGGTGKVLTPNACPVFVDWLDSTVEPQVGHEYYLSDSGESSLSVVQFLTQSPWACTSRYALTRR